MSKYSLTHLSDGALMHGLKEQVANDWATTALMLAHIAEVDARKLYLPAAYPSMYAYCMGELHFSEDAAAKRIRAARKAHEFPALFVAVAEGRLHLGAVVLLAPKLTAENVDELIAAATHKSKAEIEQMLAECFPREDVPARMDVFHPAPAPGPVDGAFSLSPGKVNEPAPGHVERSRIAPRAPERPAVQCTILRSTDEKLQYARALLGHQSGAKDSATLLDQAMDAWIEQLEKQKFAKTSRPGRGGRRGASVRHIPAEIKRRVWERDRGQCTFVSEKGQRCSARSRLEFDHADPVARGGQATLDRIRLLCRAHNQYEAEQLFGVPFMNHKREQAKRATAVRKEGAARREARASMPPVAAAHTAPALEDPERDVVPWLRQLGYRPDEARRAAAHCEAIPDASLEERLRLALKCLAPPHRKVAAPEPASGGAAG